MSDTISRVEDILENIIGEESHDLEPPLSDVEAILQAILNDTEIDITGRDRINKILLAIKNNTEYTDPPLSRVEEILLSILAGEEYIPKPGEPLSRVEELLIEWSGKTEPTYEKTVSGTTIHVTDAIEAPAVSLKVTIEPKQDGTPFVGGTTTEPYLSKTATTTGNKRYLDKIVGGTVVWNQGIPLDTSQIINMVNINIALSDNEYILTTTAGSNRLKYAKLGEAKMNHVYFISAELKMETCIITIGFYLENGGAAVYQLNRTEENKYIAQNGITKITSNNIDILLRTSMSEQSGGTARLKNPQLIDLTLMFGSTIADYIYSLEQSEAGAGVQWLKDYRFIDETYRAYNPGELISTRPEGIQYGSTTATFGSPVELRGLYKLDANNKLYCDGDELTPEGVMTAKFAEINLGDYTYSETAMSNNRKLFSTSYLNFPKTPYYDRSTPTPSICPIGFATYQQASVWNVGEYVFAKNSSIIPESSALGFIVDATKYADATAFKNAVSGIHLVYLTATPTTSTSETYPNPVDIENGDTEAFIDTRSIPLPVGNESHYAGEYAVQGKTGLTVNHAQTQEDTPTTYSVTFTEQGTVYGGTVDIVSGALTITWGYIASYNGETLTGRWLSSMDVYAEGTTPTTGAEVAYELATPITATLTPIEVQMLLGENYISNDVDGQMELTYTGTNPAMMMQSLRVQNTLLKKQGFEPISINPIGKLK